MTPPTQGLASLMILAVFERLGVGEVDGFDYVKATATTGDDYIAVAGTLTFVPGQTAQTISVPIKGDPDEEPVETFFVDLSNPINSSFGDNQGIGTIEDDDGITLRTLNINGATVNESLAGDFGTTILDFSVTLSSASADPVMVDFATMDLIGTGAATAGFDYTQISGTLIFAPGSVRSEERRVGKECRSRWSPYH